MSNEVLCLVKCQDGVTFIFCVQAQWGKLLGFELRQQKRTENYLLLISLDLGLVFIVWHLLEKFATKHYMNAKIEVGNCLHFLWVQMNPKTSTKFRCCKTCVLNESVTIRPQNSSQAQNLKAPTPKPQPQINNPNLQRRNCLGRIIWLPFWILQYCIVYSKLTFNFLSIYNHSPLICRRLSRPFINGQPSDAARFIQFKHWLPALHYKPVTTSLSDGYGSRQTHSSYDTSTSVQPYLLRHTE